MHTRLKFLTEYVGRGNERPGDVAFQFKATRLVATVLTDPSTLPPTARCYRFDNAVRPEFAVLWLQKLKRQPQSWPELFGLEMPVPSLEKQDTLITLAETTEKLRANYMRKLELLNDLFLASVHHAAKENIPEKPSEGEPS